MHFKYANNDLKAISGHLTVKNAFLHFNKYKIHPG